MSLFQAWPAIGLPFITCWRCRVSETLGFPLGLPASNHPPPGQKEVSGMQGWALVFYSKPFQGSLLPSASSPHFLARHLAPYPLACGLPNLASHHCLLPCCSQKDPVWTLKSLSRSSLPCSLHSVAPAWKEPPYSSPGQPLLPFWPQLTIASPWKPPLVTPAPSSVSQLPELCFLLLPRGSPHCDCL